MLALVMLGVLGVFAIPIIWSETCGRDCLVLATHHGGWGVIAIVVVVLHSHFRSSLLSRSLKRNPPTGLRGYLDSDHARDRFDLVDCTDFSSTNSN